MPGAALITVEGMMRACIESTLEERAACAELVRATGCACRKLGAVATGRCPKCQGSGYRSPSPAVACSFCGGIGEVVTLHAPACPIALATAIEARGEG
jgi:DnaJ-class molecular chaperone